MRQQTIISLTLFTALVHLYLAVGSFGGDNNTLSILFILNFIGYITLLAIILFIADSQQSSTVLGVALAVYALITIFAYFIVNYSGDLSDLIDPLGILTKLAELALIILIYLDLKSSEREFLKSGSGSE